MTADVPAPDITAEQMLTGAEALALGDIGPYELVEGRIVRMSPTKPRHGKYEARLAKFLMSFVDERRLGEVQVGEVGIYTHRDPDTVRAADILFVSNERLAKASPDSFLDVAPELVVEIAGPDDCWSDVQQKLREYFAAGVLVGLVVDPQERVVMAYRSPTEARELRADTLLTIEDILPGFSLPVADLF